jgi:hypothetical protein
VAKEKAPVQGRFRLVEAVIDSGAEESVAPPGMFDAEVKSSAMSRAGGKYRAANGARIPNLGQQRVTFTNDDGDRCGTVFQVAAVERPLISASQLAASGNAVTIDKSGGRITNERTGRSMKLVRRGGVFVLRMWVPANPSPGFAGQGGDEEDWREPCCRPCYSPNRFLKLMGTRVGKARLTGKVQVLLKMRLRRRWLRRLMPPVRKGIPVHLPPLSAPLMRRHTFHFVLGAKNV